MFEIMSMAVTVAVSSILNVVCLETSRVRLVIWEADGEGLQNTCDVEFAMIWLKSQLQEEQ